MWATMPPDPRSEAEPIPTPVGAPLFPSPKRANYTLAVLLIAYVLSFIDRQILSLMVDPVRRDLGLSDLQIGLLQGFAFVLLYSLLGVPLGLMADRFSRRKIISVGIVFWSAATMACGAASSFVGLFSARMAVGVGEAALSPAAHSLMSDTFPPHRRTRAMAIYALGITLGTGMAFVVGGAVIRLVASSPTVTLPLLGPIRSWQAAFIIVGLPGFLVAILTALMSEPSRSIAHKAATSGSVRARMMLLLRYLRADARGFGGIYLSSGLLAIAGISIISWYPTLLIRSYGLSPERAGTYFGLIYLVFGSAGTMSGAMVAEWLARRGYADANLRVVWLCAIGVVVPATLAPLMPTATGTLLLLAVVCFVYSAYFGCATAAIQAATMPSLRATNAALFLLVNALFSTTLGAVIVPIFDKTLFGGTGQLGPSLALVAVLSPAAAALAAGYGLRGYARLIARAV